MKLNRFVALAAIALLVVGAIGAISARTFAQSDQPALAPQAQVTEAPEEQEPASGPDTDTVQDQSGDQQDANDSAEVPGQADSGPNDQAPLYNGSITLDQSTTEGMNESDESAALASQAKITADEAKAAALAANPGATVVEVELDNENGALVYSVELNNGADVKVDAGNGAILHTETDADTGE